MTLMTAKMPAVRLRSLVSTGAIGISCFMYWFLQVRPLTSSPGFAWNNFRQYFAYDQYSYLAIAVNVRNGNLAAVEPFTETGTNHYPRLYYVFLGLLARLFDKDIILTWQVTGLAFQLIMVIAISWLLIRLTGVPALGALGFVPSIIGTFAVLATGNWHHTLDNHAVLWGAFGVLFTLNGESAALSLAVTAVCLLIGATFPAGHRLEPVRQRKRSAAIIVAAGAVGFLANVQTYSFLTTVYLLLYAAAAYGLLSYGRRIHVIASLGILAAVLFGGPTIASVAGPLATLMAGVLAAVPGFLLLLLRYKTLVISSCAALALTASPTILGTLLGLAAKDDFLTYRELSSKALGVPLETGLLAALVPLLFLALIFWAGLRQRNRAWLAFSIGAVFAWPVVASNDLWGANQEPYRFWIDSFTIITAAAVPVLLQVAVESWRLWRRSVQTGTINAASIAEEPATDGGAVKTATYTAQTTKPRFTGTVVTAMIAALVTVSAVVVSFGDFPKFTEYVESYGTANFHDEQSVAIKNASKPLTDDDSDLKIRRAADGTASELVMFDPCISQFRVKAITGLPTAFYNLGLAWPKEETKLREVLEQRADYVFAQPLAASMGVKYVLTDSGCKYGWQDKVDGTKVSESRYKIGEETAVISLWKIK